MAYRVDISRNDIAALFDLRGDPALLAAHLQTAKLALPAGPNTRAAHGPVTLLRVGPRRLVLLGASLPDAALAAALGALAADPLLAAADISDAFIAFTVAGPEAQDVMAQATPLDIGREAFAEDAASFTEVFGQTGLVMRAAGGFAVLIERSYGDYIEAFFRAAAGIGR